MKGSVSKRKDMKRQRILPFVITMILGALVTSAPASAQTALSSANYTLISLGGLNGGNGTPSTLFQDASSFATYGFVVVGSSGTVTFCSGYVGQNFFGILAACV